MLKYILCFAVILILTYILSSNSEHMVGYGTIYGVHSNPSPKCELDNDCFPGFYNRTQIYQNMCEPLDTDRRGLLREKRNVVDGCVKTLGNNLPALPNNIHCDIDADNQRHCVVER
jgi:hypothetical protein